MRKHPIDGFNKMHRGTDFAAPMGTPIMASGDGVIKKAGWCGGGGMCVIRHNLYTKQFMHTCLNLLMELKWGESKTRSNNWICWVNW